MPATIRQVALAAGGSAATVSRALSGSPLVDPRTREAVLRTAADLDYVPNRAARGLITGRTGNLALVVPDLTDPGIPPLAKAVLARAREADHAVFVVDDRPDAELAAVRSLAKQVDGIVLCAPTMSADELRATAASTTAVLVHRRSDDLPAVTVDGPGGLRQAVAHLAALGHRRIAHLVSARGSRAVRQAARAASVDLVEFPGGPGFAGGVAAADLVAAAGVSAVIADSDPAAVGVMARLAARGVRVPHDVSVVGFGDLPLAAMVTPTLTTVAVPQDLAGRAAVDLLLRLLAGGRVSRKEIPARLVVRESTDVRR